MLDWCDAMDIQWKDTLESILLVGPLTTWENSKGNRYCSTPGFGIRIRLFDIQTGSNCAEQALYIG